MNYKFWTKFRIKCKNCTNYTISNYSIHKEDFRKFRRTITNIFKYIEITILTTYNSVKVENYPFLKDTINKNYKTCLVNKFTCSRNLDTQYIGETEWQSFVKIKEINTTNSTIFKHITNCDYCQKCKNDQIL